MLEIKLFNPSWPLRPISGAKVDNIPFTVISTRSFDCRLCSKVFSGVSICSKPFRFVQKITTRGYFSPLLVMGRMGNVGEHGLYGVDGHLPITPHIAQIAHSAHYYFSRLLSPSRPFPKFLFCQSFLARYISSLIPPFSLKSRFFHSMSPRISTSH